MKITNKFHDTYISCSPDPTTNYETKNPNFHEFIKLGFVVSELVVRSGEQHNISSSNQNLGLV